MGPDKTDGPNPVLVTTTRPDKYDRYLAEVFLRLAKGEGKAQPLDKLEAVSLSNRQDCAPTEGIFLNNALLENGHAVRMGGSAPLEL